MDTNAPLTRRGFLRLAALAAASLAAPRWARAAAAAAVRSDRTAVFILLRGGADGLSMLVPYEDEDYRRLRPTIAIPPPGREGGAVPLARGFGLHPRLAPLLPFFRERRAAFVMGAGSEDESRSHSDALDTLAFGDAAARKGRRGWLNRALGAAVSPAPAAAVSIGLATPAALEGEFPVVAVRRADELRGARLDWPFGAGSGDALDALIGRSAAELLEAQRALDAVAPVREGAAAAAGYPDAPVGRDLFELARVLKAGLGTRVGFVDAGGWDDHANQGGSTGAMADRLGQLAQAIRAFHADLGPLAAGVVLTTLTEFGRAVEENGSGGTDHGSGGVMMVLGDRVKGGRVLGDWRGLDRAALFDARDVPVGVDFRRVVGEVLTGHLGVPRLSAVFPGAPRPPLGLL